MILKVKGPTASALETTTMADSTIPPKPAPASDLRGLAQLATQATSGVITIAEGVHQSVLGTLGFSGGPAPGQTGGLTGLIYQSVRGATRWLGRGVDSLLLRLDPWFESTTSPQREAAVAILNGIVGDRLVTDHNPLATAMTLVPARPPGPKVLLLIHGLCMNDLQWPQGPELAPDHQPVYLRYNTGLHVSQNGRQLATLLQQFAEQGPLEELLIVTHSMGGLITRSAFHYAQQQGLSWTRQLKRLVFLGTPHHGSPLEQAGNWVDSLLASTPYSAPFSQLGKVRSAGITDLRYGHLVDEDWQGHDRFHRKPDDRQPVPLPTGVACFTVAATLASQRSPLADRLIGDGLVPLHSALGQHDDPRRTLAFDPHSQWIAYRTNHLQLLTSPAVQAHLKRWLQTP